MAKFQIYEQQTVPGSVRASGQEFGAGVAQAQAQLGGVVADIGVRMVEREATFDSLTRARDLESWATESFRALEDTGDISRGETILKYTQGLREKQQELLSGHRGTGRTRAALKAQLENQVVQFEKGAREKQVKAQHAFMGDFLDQRTNQIAAQVAFAPELMGQGFEELDASIAQLADALPQTDIEKYRNSGRSSMVVSTLSQLESRGQVDAADALLKNPEYTKYLNPDQSRRFVMNIGAEKGKRALEAEKKAANLQTVASVMGVDSETMTPQQRMIAESFSNDTMEYAEKLNLIQMVQGSPATPEQRSKVFNLDSARKQTGLQNLLAELPAFESNRMDPESRSAFAVQVEKLLPTQYRKNEDTGQYEPIKGSGGIERLNQIIGRPSSGGGVPSRQSRVSPGGNFQGNGYAGGSAAAAATGQREILNRELTVAQREGNTELVQSLQRELGRLPDAGGADTNTFEAGAAAELGDAPTIERLGGLWGLADKVAGPVAGVKRAVGGGPVSFGIGQDEVGAAREVELQQRNLVRVLQQNPRYAEGERQDIAKSISIEPNAFSNPDAYRTRLIQIAKFAQEEMAYQSSVLKKSPTETTPEMRQQAMQAIPLFQKFTERMQLPPRLKPEEAKKLPKGTVFLTTDWQLKQVN
jgi:predicted RNA-binding Zn ribbon-like protein